MASALGEFDLIRRYFTQKDAGLGVDLGVGDDCALLQIPAGQQLAVSIDTLVEGQHFLPAATGAQVATRLTGAALSDLAAMGATPCWMTLALTLPKLDQAWVESFSQSLYTQLDTFGVALIGGDTTKGPLTLSAQVHGHVPIGHAMLRRGARVGDLVCVTGSLGDSFGGLQLLLSPEKEAALTVAEANYLKARFFAPSPRIAEGLAIRDYASACVDVSDGLLADLRHLLTASGVSAHIHTEDVPISSPLQASLGANGALLAGLTGGEDFELCFTLPPKHQSLLDTLPSGAAIVGRIVENDPEKGVCITGVEHLDVGRTGFDHFA